MILQDIQIINTGDSDDGFSSLYVDKNGSLEIKNGALISRNGNLDANKNTGIGSKGTVTMSGGKIKGFETGIYMDAGTFTMTGGVITENKLGINTDHSNVVINLKGGTISNNSYDGVNIGNNSQNAAITLSGTTITGNGHKGMWLGGKNSVIKLEGGTISNNKEHGVETFDESENTAITLSGTTIKGNGINDNGGQDGLELNGTNVTFTMTGGEITENKGRGVLAKRGDGVVINLKGGIISNNSGDGVQIEEESENATITLSGTDITGNGEKGLHHKGKNSVIKLEGGTISNNGTHGVEIRDESENTTITLSGTTIKGNGFKGNAGRDGLELNGKNNTFTMTGGEITENNGLGVRANRGNSVVINLEGGTISNNGNHGVEVTDESTGAAITMTSGIIRGNKKWGVFVRGKNSTLNITGGTINGKDGVNPNNDGAVIVPTKNRISTVSGENLSAKTAADGNLVTAGLTGTWDN